MAIPEHYSIPLPFLEALSDGKAHKRSELVVALASHFRLSEEDLSKLMPNGHPTIFYSRIGWAKAFLLRAGLVVSPKKGHFHITVKGRELLDQKPTQLDRQTLKSLGFGASHSIDVVGQIDVIGDRTPEESMAASSQQLRDALAAELLETIKKASPAFFERLVVDLLVKMGYGGSFKDAGRAIGRSGDEGIDGVIKEDKLGLDVIYIQAKRWDGKVGRPEIQRFAGALQGQRARKGVFLTTGIFTPDAEQYAKAIDSKIVLIDGYRLADLMIDHQVGVATASTYEIKRIDEDYFADE